MYKYFTLAFFSTWFAFIFPFNLPFGHQISSFPQKQPPHLDQLKAERFVVRNLDGKPVELNKLIGEGKPVVIDIWATWCGPCRQEIPHLVEFNRQYGKDELIIIGLTIEDPQTDRSAVKNFVKQFKMNYQVAFAPESIYDFFSGNTPRLIIPQTIIFAADGKVIRRLIGYNETKGREILKKAIEQAVGVTQ